MHVRRVEDERVTDREKDGFNERIETLIELLRETYHHVQCDPGNELGNRIDAAISSTKGGGGE